MVSSFLAPRPQPANSASATMDTTAAVKSPFLNIRDSFLNLLVVWVDDRLGIAVPSTAGSFYIRFRNTVNTIDTLDHLYNSWVMLRKSKIGAFFLAGDSWW